MLAILWICSILIKGHITLNIVSGLKSYVLGMSSGDFLIWRNFKFWSTNIFLFYFNWENRYLIGPTKKCWPIKLSFSQLKVNNNKYSYLNRLYPDCRAQPKNRRQNSSFTDWNPLIFLHSGVLLVHAMLRLD